VRRGLLVFCVLVLLAVLTGCGGPSYRVTMRRIELGGSSGGCGGVLSSRRDYGWPVRPFAVQHPIRGGFGDPRTISSEEFGLDGVGDPGSYSFHNGVDISARVGTPVYPVVSGQAYFVGADEVRVRAGRRVFQYIHIAPLVAKGAHVVAETTSLGTVRLPFRHVHLTEIDGDRVVNPLLHLRPYADRTIPVVQWLDVEGPTGFVVDPNNLSGDVSALAEADDLPPLPVPGAWNGFPLAPAFVRVALIGQDGVVLWSRTVADFRRSEPPRRDFWDVYAAGTYLNFPVFANHYYWRQPGHYVFLLTQHPLDTRHFANGSYTLRVVAADICGNRGILSEQIRIRN
jgi:hypothetical protein